MFIYIIAKSKLLYFEYFHLFQTSLENILTTKYTKLSIEHSTTCDSEHSWIISTKIEQFSELQPLRKIKKVYLSSTILNTFYNTFTTYLSKKARDIAYNPTFVREIYPRNPCKVILSKFPIAKSITQSYLSITSSKNSTVKGCITIFS